METRFIDLAMNKIIHSFKKDEMLAKRLAGIRKSLFSDPESSSG
jgi:hypothetical protein|tara:strand:+ start:395 stop:526 length:132 start_codon:yes stop_codon:yes gene_type:complete